METTLSLLAENREALTLFLLFSIFYFSLTGFKTEKAWPFYFGGLGVFLIALMTSTAFSSHMLFSVHMINHVVLLLICGPLLVIGWPRKTNTHPLFLKNTYSYLVKHPLICWLTGIGIMWFWHIPSILKALMMSHQQSFSSLNLAHLGSLLIAGIIFTWPIINPKRNYRIYPPIGIIYLFTACIACSLLGLLITFAPTELYHSTMANSYPEMTQMGENINPETDQQIAGLIMWVPCCFIYLFGVLYLLLNWLKKPNKKTLSPSKVLISENHD